VVSEIDLPVVSLSSGPLILRALTARRALALDEFRLGNLTKRELRRSLVRHARSARRVLDVSNANKRAGEAGCPTKLCGRANVIRRVAEFDSPFR
jgi:hypothetical protein